MAEKRKSERSICVKIGAKARFKIELFDASQWSESAQVDGRRYRLRINRRWYDGPDGAMLFLDMVQIAALVGRIASGQDPCLPEPPDLPRGSRVAVPNGRVLDGTVMHDVTWTVTEPVLDYGGHWLAGVMLARKGCVMVPVDRLVRKG